MKSMSRFNKQQKGFTLIEISIVLAIIGVLIAGAVKGRDMYYQTKGTGEIADLQFMAGKLQGKYRSVANTAGVTMANAIAGNVFPTTMTISGATVANQFSGAVTVAPATIAVANDGFTITDGGIGRTACQTIAAGLFSSTSSLKINTTTVYSNYGTLVAYDPGTTDTACNESDNTITFVVPKG